MHEYRVLYNSVYKIFNKFITHMDKYVIISDNNIHIIVHYINSRKIMKVIMKNTNVI